MARALKSHNNLVDSSGKQVVFGRELGRGGEGTVFETSNAQLVVKMYHRPLDAPKQEKLKVMARAKTEDLLRVATWPVDTVHDARTGQVVGFFMPRLNGYDELHTLYSPAHRKQDFPNVDWAFLIHTARNVAAAVATCHQMGHIVGDINPNNLVVSKSATVKLIDCDSFQIESGSRYYLCEVGVPHFTSPELHNKPLDSTIRTPNHDGFGLALFCFLLLFMGRHPFAGKYLNGTQDMPIERAIREFRFAYSSSAKARQMERPPNSLSLSVVPTAMQHMFERAFGQEGASGRRPSAAQWVQELEALRLSLSVCNILPCHKYSRSLSGCPWCELEAQTNLRFFICKRPSPQVLDLDAVWNQILAVTPPPVGAPTLPQIVFAPAPRAIVLPDRATAKETSALYRREQTFRQNAVTAATQKLGQIQGLWMQHLAEHTFELKLAELQKHRDNYRTLAQWFLAEQRKLEGQSRELQLRDYLKRYFIERAKISGIGPTRRATLASYGIETAADISRSQVLAIPGFGYTLTQELLNWRNRLANGFVFDPNQGLQPAELDRVESQFLVRSASSEKALRGGASELTKIKQDILSKRQALILEREQYAKELSQAKADLAFVEQQLRALKAQAVRERLLPSLQRIFVSAIAGLLLMSAAYTVGPRILSIVGALLGPTSELLPTRTTLPQPTPTANASRLPTPTPLSFTEPRVSVHLTTWMYEQPKTTSNLVGDIEPEEIVSLMMRDRSSTWCNVKTDSAEEGWVYCTMLDTGGRMDRVPYAD
jgi:DNA-binding helix-hairpin-helix protein with protein kinase domain